MRFVRILNAQVLRWMTVLVSIAVFANSQNAPSASRNGNQFYKVQLSTGQVISDTFLGTRLQGAATLVTEGAAGWVLVGVGDFRHNGDKGLVYSESSTGALAVIFYGGPDGTILRNFSPLAAPGAGWTARAVADLNGDGHPDVIFVDKTTGQVDVYFYGGLQGTSFLGGETIGPLSATGWKVVGATDLNADGHPDLILQNSSTRQILIQYLGGSKGTTVTATEELAGSGFAGWTAAGMQDMNGDGHPDLILVNDVTGQSRVSYFGGPLGTAYLGADYLDVSGSPGWSLVIPSGTGSTSTLANNVAAQTPTPAVGAGAIPDAASTPVLIFNGTGTSSTDVTAVENVVKTAGLGYKTANSSQLDAMSQAQLAAYKLFIVPGGDSIKIGNNVSSKATMNVRNAVAQNGLNYLGFCAGGFFGGFSKYNGLNLTSGVWFSLYADYYKGIHKEAVTISFPSQKKLDIYWQNGPDLSGWGSIVGRYPNGRAALTEGHWGNGFVLLSGVHPEAPAAWRYGMQFNTPLDVDLAYAATLVTSALNGVMLPHY
ncbi:MAG: VCBS repeat-containing protein [Terriglobales bacterium]